MVKKLSLLLSLSVCILGFAQRFNEKEFEMQVAKLENATKQQDFDQSKNYFIKYVDYISKGKETNKEDWRAYYYTALSIVRSEITSQRNNKTQGIEAISGLAEKYISGIFVKNPDNSEANILLAQIYVLQAKANQENAINYITSANTLISKAETEDSTNPRIDLIKGELALFSSSNNEVNKQLAVRLFDSAIEKFKTYKKTSKLNPNWGKEDAIHYLSTLK